MMFTKLLRNSEFVIKSAPFTHPAALRARPLFAFGGKRVFFSLPSFPLAEERVTSEAMSGE
jgi:hypothetical protein